jgi:putative flippase GtrA
MTAQAFPRFLLSGAFNTAVTYALYLGLLAVFPYWFSYSAAYASGILLAYFLSRNFVFGRSPSGTRLLAFPLVYVVQYLLGLTLAYLWVDVLRMPAAFAPLAALLVTLPVTFLLTRWVFHGGESRGPRPAAVVTPPPPGVRGAQSSRLPIVFALLLIPPLVLVVLLWLPFGFRMGGLIEEWGVLGLFATHGLFFLADVSSPLAAHALRPLTIFPHALGYLLDPNSFVWWHLQNMVSLLVKGAATGFLAYVVLRSIGWALAASVLVLVYPADTMQLSLRGLHINVALALLLLGACLAVAGHYQRTRRAAALSGAAAALLFLVSALMYETSLALLPLPLLVLIAAEGLRPALRLVRARPELAAMWFAGAVLWLLNAGIVSASHVTFQAAAGSQLLPTLAHTWSKLFTVAALRALVGGWYDAWGMLRQEFGRYVYLLAAALMVSGAVLLARRWSLRLQTPATPAVTAPRWRPVARLAVCGVLMLLLGFAPYLVDEGFLTVTQRTYLFATPGAAFVWLAALVTLAGASRVIASGAFFVLLLAGLAAQLFQFHHYLSISEQQRRALRSIVEAQPGDFGGRTLIVLDGSQRLNHTWMLRENLPFALAYLYGRPVAPVEICLMPARSWQHIGALGRSNGECVEDAAGWHLRPAAPVSGPGMPASKAESETLIPAAKALVVRIAPDNSVAADSALASYRERLAHGDDLAARRYRAVLLPRGPSPLLRQFRDEREVASYHMDFGRWWSMDEPIHGSGWSDPGWVIGRLHHDAAAWTIADPATLVFDVQPAPGGSVMRGQFTAVARPEQGIPLRLNGRPLVARWPDPLHFEADLPPGMLASGRNELEISAPPSADQFGFGVRMTHLEVVPR